MKKTQNKRMKKAIQLLEELVYQADEDCPQECRTRHFSDILLEASEFVKECKNQQ
jgi:predicted Zn-dependent protease with MMP-like domain